MVHTGRLQVVGVELGKRGKCVYCGEEGADVGITIQNNLNDMALYITLHSKCAKDMAEALALALEYIAEEVRKG